MILRAMTLFLVALVFSFSAMAISLDEAKAQGLVGENSAGYLGVIKSSSEVAALVKDINAKRKVKYQALADKNGITLAQVEALAAAKAIEKTHSGHYVEVNGRWVKK